MFQKNTKIIPQPPIPMRSLIIGLFLQYASFITAGKKIFDKPWFIPEIGRAHQQACLLFMLNRPSSV
jgi:hypothetical protein